MQQRCIIATPLRLGYHLLSRRRFGPRLEHFQAKWTPVRVKKMRKKRI
jgi:hypothetical protein